MNTPENWQFHQGSLCRIFFFNKTAHFPASFGGLSCSACGSPRPNSVGSLIFLTGHRSSPPHGILEVIVALAGRDAYTAVNDTRPGRCGDPHRWAPDLPWLRAASIRPFFVMIKLVPMRNDEARASPMPMYFSRCSWESSKVVSFIGLFVRASPLHARLPQNGTTRRSRRRKGRL